MNGYYHPDIELEMEKGKRREFYQEVERVALVKEALRDQPGLLTAAVNRFVSLFKPAVSPTLQVKAVAPVSAAKSSKPTAEKSSGSSLKGLHRA